MEPYAHTRKRSEVKFSAKSVSVWKKMEVNGEARGEEKRWNVKSGWRQIDIVALWLVGEILIVAAWKCRMSHGEDVHVDWRKSIKQSIRGSVHDVTSVSLDVLVFRHIVCSACYCSTSCKHSRRWFLEKHNVQGLVLSLEIGLINIVSAPAGFSVANCLDPRPSWSSTYKAVTACNRSCNESVSNMPRGMWIIQGWWHEAHFLTT